MAVIKLLSKIPSLKPLQKNKRCDLYECHFPPQIFFGRQKDTFIFIPIAKTGKQKEDNYTCELQASNSLPGNTQGCSFHLPPKKHFC